MNIDVYTPWREDLQTLQERHVGRAAVVETIANATGAYIEQKNPLPIYVFGPRGSGKSHLLGLSAQALKPLVEGAGLKLLTISEDIPELTDAAAVLARVRAARERPGWMRAAQPRGPSAPESIGRAVVFFEALDKHLVAMSEEERRKLREAWAQEDFFIVATGCTLPEALTGKEGAFYTAFQAWPLAPLTDAESKDLLERVAGQGTVATVGWPARCAALISLAGGSPRTLVALGTACGQAPEVWASEHLHTVVRQFTAHYQLRFRDLSPQAQQLVELLSISPRELTPTELGEHLGFSASQASTLCRRLLEEGVVLDRQEGRNTWYRMGEPLFRFWYEYRTAPWEETRIAWLGRMIEIVMSPAEMVVALLENPDEGVHEVIEQALKTSAKAARVRAQLLTRFGVEMEEGNQRAALAILARWQSTGAAPDAAYSCRMAAMTHWSDQQIRLALSPLLEDNGVSCISSAWVLEEHLDRGESMRNSFTAMLAGLPPLLASPSPAGWSNLRSRTLVRLDVVDEWRGQPWVLQPTEREQLARAPFLRAVFLERGLHITQGPLLSPGDVDEALHRDVIPDWHELLAVTMRLGEEALARTLVRTGLSLEPIPLLPFNPRPGAPPVVPLRPFGQLLRRMGKAAKVALASWGATLAVMDEQSWTFALEILTVQFGRMVLSPNGRALVVSGLTALGLRRLDRLEFLMAELSGELGNANQEMVELTQRAHLLVLQLTVGKGQLHPELKRTRDILFPS